LKSLHIGFDSIKRVLKGQSNQTSEESGERGADQNGQLGDFLVVLRLFGWHDR
jgi:hypothetical protein